MLSPRPYPHLAVVITTLVLLSLGANVIASPQATTRYVSPQGTDSGTCESSEEPCAKIGYALRQSADDDSIIIACGTYKENLVIDKSVSLMAETGEGDCAIVSAPAGMAVAISGSANVRLQGLGITGGDAFIGGGLILSYATARATADRVEIFENRARFGAGIYSFGTLTITNSSIHDNVAEIHGGGIRSIAGTLLISKTAINHNFSTDAGGGIYAGDGSGSGSVTIVDSTIAANEAIPIDNFTDTRGGGIIADGLALRLDGTNINQNHATLASGIACHGCDLEILDSEISENSSEALHIDAAGAFTITGSTISAHDADAGIAVEFGWGGIANSTLSGNALGLEVKEENEVHVENCTIAFNTEVGLSALTDSAVYVSNCVIAQNGADCGPGSSGYVSAVFSNLDGDGTCPDFITGDAHLGPLQNNGGPTLTHDLGAESAAVDAGEDSVCTKLGSVDQRGFPRLDIDGNGDPDDGNPCDLGAVERGSAPPTTGPRVYVYLPLVLTLE